MLKTSSLPEQWGQVIRNGLCSYFAGCKRQFTSILPIIATGLPCTQANWLLSASSPISPKETASLPEGHWWDQCCWEPLTCLCLVLKQSAQIPWLPAVDPFMASTECTFDKLTPSSVSHYGLLSPSKLVQNLTWALHHQWVWGHRKCQGAPLCRVTEGVFPLAPRNEQGTPILTHCHFLLQQCPECVGAERISKVSRIPTEASAYHCFTSDTLEVLSFCL